jgi:potassium efflux system protein
VSEHLSLPEPARQSLYRHVHWFLGLSILLTFVTSAVAYQPFEDVSTGGIARVALLLNLAILTLFLLIVLRPSGTLLGPFLQQHRGGWMDRLRYGWYGLCLLGPGSLMIITALGYTYAAQHFYRRVMATLLLVLACRLLNALLIRWLEVTQKRSLFKERFKQKTAKQTEPAHPATVGSESGVTNTETPEVIISSLSQQTRRLIDAVKTILLIMGVWIIWRDVLPALGALENIRLWSTGDAPDSQVISLGAMAVAILMTVMTFVVVRNVPGLIEITILQYLPLDRGVRFAISTLCRYVLAIVGVVLVFGKLGISWTKVQWLVAAMTVGLGFGLQEIFANFISGLIILFEQPVRVDDVVTVGDVTGSVTKIRIRATTIRKWDQRELIVPNKEFITGRLVNWTLSDSILRQEFVVGIAYGSDTAKAENVLYNVAANEPLVLKEPPPMVLFRAFGNSSLEFELRVYLNGIENLWTVWHRINFQIDQALRQAHIEIAFPQRDLHIRSIQPSISLVQKNAAGEETLTQIQQPH